MNTRLLVLGLLSRGPMHGYDIQKTLEVSRADMWADVLPGSIYHALKTLAAEGMVEVKATQATGHRTRAIHAITPAGRSELKRLLREAWRRTPRPYPVRFYLAIAFFDELPAEELVDAIVRLKEEVRREWSLWDVAEVEKARGREFPEQVRIAFGNAREHLEVDLRLLESLRTLAQKKAR
ncbi:MAG: PadR family transcriptional regulator [Myxococcaceae bacterium]